MQSKFIRNRDTEIKKPASGGGKLVSGKETEDLVLIGRTKISQSETFVNNKKTASRKVRKERNKQPHAKTQRRPRKDAKKSNKQSHATSATSARSPNFGTAPNSGTAPERGRGRVSPKQATQRKAD